MASKSQFERRNGFHSYNTRNDYVIQGRYAEINHNLQGFKRMFQTPLTAADAEEFYVAPKDYIPLDVPQPLPEANERAAKRRRIAAIANAYTSGKDVPTILTASLSLNEDWHNPWSDRSESHNSLLAADLRAQARRQRADMEAERAERVASRRQRRADRRLRAEKAAQLQEDGMGKSEILPVDLTVDNTTMEQGFGPSSKPLLIRLSQTRLEGGEQQYPEPVTQKSANGGQDETKGAHASDKNVQDQARRTQTTEPAAQRLYTPPISPSLVTKALTSKDDHNAGRFRTTKPLQSTYSRQHVSANSTTPWFSYRHPATTSNLSTSHPDTSAGHDRSRGKSRLRQAGPRPVAFDTLILEKKVSLGEQPCNEPDHPASKIQQRTNSAVEKASLTIQSTVATVQEKSGSTVQNAQDACLIQISNGDFSTQAAMEEVHGAFQDAFPSQEPTDLPEIDHVPQTPTRDIPNVIKTVTPFKDFHLRSRSRSLTPGNHSKVKPKILFDTQALLAAASPFVDNDTPEKASEQLGRDGRNSVRLPGSPVRSHGSHGANELADFIRTPTRCFQPTSQGTPWSLQSAGRQARTSLSYEAGQQLLNRDIFDRVEEGDAVDSILASWEANESLAARESAIKTSNAYRGNTIRS